MPEKLELKRGRLFSSPLFLSFQSPPPIGGDKGVVKFVGQVCPIYKFFDNYVDKSYINAIKAETSLESLNNLLCTLGYFNTKNICAK